jgi:hypothetical protein
MPFWAVPCKIWLPTQGEEDAWGNADDTYADEADIETSCCYSPGQAKKPDTENDIEDGRPHGARVAMTFYLPKTLDADLRDALIECYPPDDSHLSGKRFKVVGEPYSYPRANTPGNYSWCVEAVAYLG